MISILIKLLKAYKSGDGIAFYLALNEIIASVKQDERFAKDRGMTSMLKLHTANLPKEMPPPESLKIVHVKCGQCGSQVSGDVLAPNLDGIYDTINSLGVDAWVECQACIEKLEKKDEQ